MNCPLSRIPGTRIAVAGLAILAGSPAMADSISLGQWLEAALSRDAEVREAWAESSWERSRVGTVEVWEDPEVRLGAEDRTDRGDQTSVALRMPVPNPWEAIAEKRQARARADAEYLRAEAIEWKRRMMLSSIYFEAVYQYQVLQARRELHDGLQADLGTARKGVEAHAMNQLRFLDLKGEQAVSASQLAEEEMEWTAQLEELRALAGWESGSMGSLATALPSPELRSPVPGLEQCRLHAMGGKGDLAALSAEERQESARRSEERSSAIPWITFLEASWARENERDRDDLEARVGISLPVFTWLRRSNTEAALSLVRARERTEAQRNALESALESAWHRASAAERRLLTVYEATGETIREISTALESGYADPRQRSGLRDVLFDLRRAQLEAALDYQRAILDLVGTAGPGFPLKVN